MKEAERRQTQGNHRRILRCGARSTERARLPAFHRGSPLRELFLPKGSASGQASCWGGRPPTASLCQNETVEASQTREPSVDKIIRIGIDTSKSVFVLHGVNAADEPVLRKKLRRRQVLDFFRLMEATRIGLEACGAADYGAGKLVALGPGVVLLPPQYVKPYVQRGKNDAADASAICEAMSRPRMRFVSVKTAEQQAALMLMGVREQLIARRTQLANMIRGYAAEFGVTAAKGLDKIEPLLAQVAMAPDVPELAK